MSPVATQSAPSVSLMLASFPSSFQTLGEHLHWHQQDLPPRSWGEVSRSDERGLIDLSAEELLVRIQAEKAELIKQGKLTESWRLSEERKEIRDERLGECLHNESSSQNRHCEPSLDGVAIQSAEQLYNLIQDDKAKLAKTGKIEKIKYSHISEEEIPFDIPENWKWVRWGELAYSIQYGYNAPAQSTGDIKMVRISDIQNGKILWETVPFCNITEENIPTYLLRKNDILFARTGGTVGKSYLVKDTLENAIYAGYLIRTRYNDKLLCPEYLKFFMESNLYWIQLRNGTIATAQPNCNGKTLSKMILPLPPLAEQHRIVAKIEELFTLVDKLQK